MQAALWMAAVLATAGKAERDSAAWETAIMCGEAYLQSARIAEQCEPLSPITDAVQTRLGVTTAEAMPGAACPGWYINREPFLDVIRMHRASVNNIGSTSARVVTGVSPVQAERSSAAAQLSELIDPPKPCRDEPPPPPPKPATPHPH